MSASFAEVVANAVDESLSVLGVPLEADAADGQELAVAGRFGAGDGLRCAYRYRHGPDARDVDFGFRLALDLE